MGTDDGLWFISQIYTKVMADDSIQTFARYIVVEPIGDWFLFGAYQNVFSYGRTVRRQQLENNKRIAFYKKLPPLA